MSVLVTSRPLDEYCGLFGLTRAELSAVPGPVLDCPGGAAGLVAEARTLGCRAIAVDPGYAVPPHELATRARAGQAVMAAAIRADPARHLPRYHRADGYLRSWDRARRLFAADAAAHPERYVAAALPHLPFADGTFALTLSSYLLFAYPDLFSPRQQLAALLELVRVTDPAGEVRIHPLHDSAGARCPRLDELRAELGRRQVSSEVRRYGRPTTHRVLVLRAADHRRRGGAGRVSAGRERTDRSVP
ncbi:hypothetical protein AB0K43_21590 [Kitasatospora sp. NPDC049258]|uniref:hypothetical protein n=1 Tax=Kitasatospora sp. NPDC049258 TaxID=3155394 RepID=UPI003447216F